MNKSNERKRKERSLKRDAGLKRFELWVRPEHQEQIKQFALKLQNKIPVDE